MTWRHYFLLALLGLIVAVTVAAFQRVPGYMDADYYYAGGIQLASGRGFTEPYLWNYLDDPAGLPHPSNAYWMPLASILAAAGAISFGPSSWNAARIGFLAVVTCIPPVTAALAYALTSRRYLALVSGLLAVFSVFYLPILTTTDTFGLYMLLGGLFFLILTRKPSSRMSFFLGLVAGLMHLTRADGLMWLGVAILAVVFVRPNTSKKIVAVIVTPIILCLAGYLVVMGPWLIRNLHAFGTPLAPGGSRSLWLTDYNQLFSYPASQLTFSSWWQTGMNAILKARLWAFSLNMANTLSVQGEIFLIPLIGVGCWSLRKNRCVQIAILAWFLTISAMTVAFPFAGARGGFIHSGAALQSVWWAVAPAGLDQLIAWVSGWRKWKQARAQLIFHSTLVGAMLLFTGYIAYSRVVRNVNDKLAWGQESLVYQQIGEYLSAAGALDDARVVVANPPGFYLATGHPAIALPDGDAETIKAVAQKYQAQYLILEKDSTPGGLLTIYKNINSESTLHYLGEVQEARIFVIQP